MVGSAGRGAGVVARGGRDGVDGVVGAEGAWRGADGVGDAGGCRGEIEVDRAMGGPIERDWDLGGVQEGVAETADALLVGEEEDADRLAAPGAGEVPGDGRDGDLRMLGAEVDWPSKIGPSLSLMVLPRLSATVAPDLLALIRSVRPTHLFR